MENYLVRHKKTGEDWIVMYPDFHNTEHNRCFVCVNKEGDIEAIDIDKLRLVGHFDKNSATFFNQNK